LILSLIKTQGLWCKSASWATTLSLDADVACADWVMMCHVYMSRELS
jgi:hypothetical protein